MVYCGIRVAEKKASINTSLLYSRKGRENRPFLSKYPRRFAERRFDSGGGEEEGKQMEQRLKMEIDGMVRALGLCQEVEGNPDECWKCPMNNRREG